MVTYLISIGVICFCLLLAMNSLRLRYIAGINTYRLIPSRFPVILIFLVLVGLYTFRWCNGTDFFNYYMDFYSNDIQSFDYVTEHRDVLFALITYVTKNYISDNFLVYNAMLAILTYAPVFIVMRIYSYNFSATVLLYIFSIACFIPYNIVRQGIAIAIMFGSFPFLIQKRYIKFMFCSFLAITFHSTAAIAAIIMIFCNSDFLSKRIKLLLVLFFGSGVFLRSIWDSFINLLEAIGQTKLATDYADALSGSTGVNILHILVALIPFFLIFACRHRLLNNSDKNEYNFNSFYMNCILFYVGSVFLGLYNPIFVRMGKFFEIYLFLLYPKLIKETFVQNRMITVVVLIVYFIYFLIVLQQGGNYVPYQFNHYSLEGIIMWK